MNPESVDMAKPKRDTGNWCWHCGIPAPKGGLIALMEAGWFVADYSLSLVGHDTKKRPVCCPKCWEEL